MYYRVLLLHCLMFGMLMLASDDFHRTRINHQNQSHSAEDLEGGALQKKF